MAGNRRMWDIGNTTVRNPERLMGALRVFRDTVDGKVFNEETQIAYWQALKDSGALESDGTDKAWHGRKFFSAPIQLGFVHRDSKKKLTLTPVGHRLLDYPDLQSDTFLRQLLKYRLGSPIERQNHIRIRPFVLILKALRLARERGLVGLTRDEVAAFLIPTIQDGEGVPERIIEQVEEFRRQSKAQTGMVARRRFVGSVLDSAAPKGRKASTLRDYADSSMRYARLSGLVTLSASGGRYTLTEARLDDVLEILDNLPGDVPDSEYISYLQNPDLPELPTDDVAVASERVEELRTTLATTEHVEIPREVLTAPLPSGRAALQQELFNLERYAQIEEETKYYKSQRRREALEEVRDILKEVKKKSNSYGTYRPAMLEWALWRFGLAVNSIEGSIAETRGFNVDADFNPINHAAPNRPDMNFRYPDGDALVVEGTLLASARQVAAEGEPVRRHVAVYKARNRGHNVRALFIAPSIDPNTYNEFYRGEYEIDDVDYSTEIVPLTIDDISYLIEKMLAEERIIDHSGLLRILDALLALREELDSGKAWRKALPRRFRQLVDEVVASAPTLQA